MGVAVGDFDNDGFPDLYVTCVGQSRLFRNTGKGDLRGRHARQRPRSPRRAQHLGAVGGLRSRRTAGPVRLQLRQVVRGHRRVLQPQRQAEVVLHARGLSRRHLLAVPQPRRRHLRGRHRHLRHLRLQLEVARRGDARLRRRRVARPLRGQRHAAEQAVSQPAQRPLPRRRARGRRRAERRRQGPRGHGRGRRRLRQLGPHGAGHHQLRQRDAGALPRPGHRHVPGHGAARRRGRAPRSTASGSAACSPISISTARSTWWWPTATSTRPCAASRATSATRRHPQLFLNQGAGTFRDALGAGRARRSRSRASAAGWRTATSIATATSIC